MRPFWVWTLRSLVTPAMMATVLSWMLEWMMRLLDDVGADSNEEDVEVAAVNTTDESDAAVLTSADVNIAVVAMARPRPSLLPVFVGSEVKMPSAVSTSASRGSVSCKMNTPVRPRRSPTSLSYTSSVGGRGQKIY
jgi:hypothetical protein